MYGICAQLYDSTGTPVGSEFQVNTTTYREQRHASATMDPNGNFVIAWESSLQDGDSYGIYAQRYNSSGTPVNSIFLPLFMRISF